MFNEKSKNILSYAYDKHIFHGAKYHVLEIAVLCALFRLVGILPARTRSRVLDVPGVYSYSCTLVDLPLLVPG